MRVRKKYILQTSFLAKVTKIELVQDRNPHHSICPDSATYRESGKTVFVIKRKYPNQTLDTAGRPTIVTDAKGRQMTTHFMGMQQPLKTTNIDSGTRELINDVTGKPLYMWDSRGQMVQNTYDEPPLPRDFIAWVYRHPACYRFIPCTS